MPLEGGAGIGGPGSGGHVLLLHSSWSAQVSHLADWVSEGLRRHELVIYIRNEQAEIEAGSSLTPDVEQAVSDWSSAAHARQLETWEAKAERLVDRMFGLDRGSARELEIMGRAAARGYKGVRVAVEDCSALEVVTNEDAWLAWERRVDRLCREAPFSILCRYGRGIEKSLLLDAAEIHHHHVIESILEIITSADAELRLIGEVDISNSLVLESALRAACASGKETVRVDLKELQFADVSACRAFAHGTELARLRAGRVILRDPQPGVARALRLVGVDLLPGVELAGDEPT